MQYRYNTRGVKDGERFENTLGRIESRLSWKELTKDNGFTAETIIEPEIPQLLEIKMKQRQQNPVAQILNGEIICVHPSLKEAALATGCKAPSISQVLRGIRKSTGGYKWKYV